MKLSDFKATYSLHDTTVDEIRYIDSERRLCLKIDFAQYFHPNYQEGMPELVAGTFEIRGVGSIACGGSVSDFPLKEGAKVDAEVLSFDRENGDTRRLILQLYTPKSGVEILTLQFEAADDAEVSFVPDHATPEHLRIS